MEVKLNLPEIEGYEAADGEQPRFPRVGDFCITMNGTSPTEVKEACSYVSKRIILKKKAPVYDVIEIPMSREAYCKYVEIKALEDAISIIDRMESNPNESVEDLNFGKVYNALQELIK